MYCTKCGKLLSNEAIFCSECGTKMIVEKTEKVDEVVPSDTKNEEPVFKVIEIEESITNNTQSNSFEVHTEPQTNENIYSAVKPKKKRTGLIVTAIILSLFMIIGVVVGVLFATGAFTSDENRIVGSWEVQTSRDEKWTIILNEDGTGVFLEHWRSEVDIVALFRWRLNDSELVLIADRDFDWVDWNTARIGVEFNSRNEIALSGRDLSVVMDSHRNRLIFTRVEPRRIENNGILGKWQFDFDGEFDSWGYCTCCGEFYADEFPNFGIAFFSDGTMEVFNLAFSSDFSFVQERWTLVSGDYRSGVVRMPDDFFGMDEPSFTATNDTLIFREWGEEIRFRRVR